MAHILSEEQKAVVEWYKTGNGNASNPAFAGCAKTYTTEIGIEQAPEEKILYTVFGKKNQLEAAGKIKDKRVTVSTAHGVGNSYLKVLWPKSRVPDFRMGGSFGVEANRIKMVCPEFPEEFYFVVARLVSYLKNLYINPTIEDSKIVAELRGIELYGDNSKWNEKIPQIALDAVELSKINKNNFISFDDMVYLPVALNLVKPKYDLVTVDEAQDMNMPQMVMAMQSVKSGGRMCIVGDNNQAIYGFRGALQGAMDIFKEKLNSKEFPLTITFRCPKSVVARAQAFVPTYQAPGNAPEGEVLDLEYKKVIENIKVGEVVLSRTNAPLMPLCLGLLRKKIPAYVAGRDVVKQLELIVKSVEAIDVYDFGNKIQTWQDTRTQLVNPASRTAQSRIDLIKDNAETLKEISLWVIEEGGRSVQDIIKGINNVFFDSDYVKKPSVICSSVHKAKGMEWDSVYMLQDTFGVTHPKQTPADKQEERNIQYVAITRSKNKLGIVHGLGKDDKK